MATTFAGTVSLTIGGTRYALKGNISLMGLTEVAEPVVGLDAVHGFMASPVAPYMSATVTNLNNQDERIFAALQSFGAEEGDSVVVQVDNTGKTYTLRGARVTGEVSTNPEDGETTITFSGVDFQEA